jgi:hypothetical protein
MMIFPHEWKRLQQLFAASFHLGVMRHLHIIKCSTPFSLYPLRDILFPHAAEFFCSLRIERGKRGCGSYLADAGRSLGQNFFSVP